MKCPYCGGEMEKGLIQSPHELVWLKGEKRRLFANAEFHEDSVVLSAFSYWKGSAVTAFLCRDCRKVVIDYADDTTDFNRRI